MKNIFLVVAFSLGIFQFGVGYLNKLHLKILIFVFFLPISVAAQEKNNLRSFFEFFAQGILNVGINTARNFVDIRYDEMGFDKVSNN